jgi:hypothetical protein
MDPLSEVFSLLNVENTVSARLEAGGAWAMRIDGYRHVNFGAVLRGSCWISVTAAGPAEPVDGRTVFATAANGTVRYGDGDDTVVIGAQFVFDEINAKVLPDFLPPLLRPGPARLCRVRAAPRERLARRARRPADRGRPGADAPPPGPQADRTGQEAHKGTAGR